MEQYKYTAEDVQNKKFVIGKERIFGVLDMHGVV
jgi:hypothetical protein